MWRVIDWELPRLIASVRSLLPPLEQLEREIAGEADLDC